MNFFFDTEFYESPTGLHLLSIAIVREGVNSCLHRISTDAPYLHIMAQAQQYALRPEHDRTPDMENCRWLADNVMPHLISSPSDSHRSNAQIRRDIELYVRSSMNGGSDVLAFHDEAIFWAYNGAYDWYIMCQLFGGMLKLPPMWRKNVMDLKQYRQHIAFPMHTFPRSQNMHSALVDALWNRELYARMVQYEYEVATDRQPVPSPRHQDHTEVSPSAESPEPDAPMVSLEDAKTTAFPGGVDF